MTRRLAFALLLAAQIADIATTNAALAHGAVEGNPLVALSMAHLGAVWWLPKLAVAAGGLWIVSRRRWAVIAVGSLYALAIAGNLVNSIGGF